MWPKQNELLDSQLLRWSSRYSYTVRFIKGEHNVLANYLSKPRLEETQYKIFSIGRNNKHLDPTNGESSIWQHLLDEIKGKIIMMATHPSKIHWRIYYRIHFLLQHCFNNEPNTYAMFTCLLEQGKREHDAFQAHSRFDHQILPLSAIRFYIHWIILNLYPLAIFFDL